MITLVSGYVRKLTLSPAANAGGTTRKSVPFLSLTPNHLLRAVLMRSHYRVSA